MLIPDTWKDYELLDTHRGEKLERWGDIVVARPDPQIIWPGDSKSPLWKGCHMRYHRSRSGGGFWEIKKQTPGTWHIGWESLTFKIRPTDFKHMGLFPEQAVNWQWIIDKIGGKSVRVLNLFAYTGGATSAAAAAGANVTHVDAAKGMNVWAKENAALSGVPENRLRFITDDVLKFALREQRRGAVYDAVIMDPPSYGRGPGGEVWKIEDKLFELVSACAALLSAEPLFFLINSYTTGFSPVTAENILRSIIKNGATSSGELGLRQANGLVLPCGIYARWENGYS
ncbi:MAG: class I SAM-dependent methyltransferase [Clostridiales bacterium]|jgi:23S rRNA (cytosine1962-C5)-methyltransferase|nr:class I SAM-dependent methyltransferase [Clostridiales bacterium]